MHQTNQPINIIKAIASFLVVLIHAPFPGLLGNIIKALARMAVPFFFCVSGYFFYKGNKQTELSSVFRKIKKLVRLLLLSELLYFCFYVTLQFLSIGFSFSAITNVIQSELIGRYMANPLSYILIFAPPFNRTFWFVGSLIMVYFIFYYVVKHNLQHVMLMCSAVTLCIGFCLSRLPLVGLDSIPIDRLLPCMPLPFFSLGYHLRKLTPNIDMTRDKSSIIILILGILLTIGEQFTGQYSLYVGTGIIVVSIMILCVKHRNYSGSNNLARALSYVGAKLSTGIYVFHMIVLTVIRIFFLHTLPSIVDTVFYMWSLPGLTCIFSVLCAWINYALKIKLHIHRRKNGSY